MYRSLLAAGVLERLDAPDELGRRVRLTVDLQDDFALNQPAFSLFVLDAVPRLDGARPSGTSTSSRWWSPPWKDPWPVLLAQLERLRTETLARLKAGGHGVRGTHGGAERARAPQAAGGVPLRGFRRLPRPPPLGAGPRRAPQVDCPGHVRALDEFRRVRRLLRDRPFRGPLAAVPFRRLQSTGAKRPRRVEIGRPCATCPSGSGKWSARWTRACSTNGNC